jgi:hypothetical protein
VIRLVVSCVVVDPAIGRAVVYGWNADDFRDETLYNFDIDDEGGHLIGRALESHGEGNVVAALDEERGLGRVEA